jgi:hypothetical protein
VKHHTRLANILFTIALLGFAIFQGYEIIHHDFWIAAIASVSFLLTCIGGWMMGYYWEKIRRG